MPYIIDLGLSPKLLLAGRGAADLVRQKHPGIEEADQIIIKLRKDQLVTQSFLLKLLGKDLKKVLRLEGGLSQSQEEFKRAQRRAQESKGSFGMNDIQKHVYHIIRTIDQNGECGVSGAVDLSLTLGHLITILKMLDYDVEYIHGADMYKIRRK